MEIVILGPFASHMLEMFVELGEEVAAVRVTGERGQGFLNSRNIKIFIRKKGRDR